MIFSDTSHNLIVGNNITSTAYGTYGYAAGIFFEGASNNTIYHNTFMNQYEPLDYDSVNVWDDGYPAGGNFWIDYLTRYPNATEIDNSGISNMPYVIDANNTDHYPLMEPFTSTFYANYLLETTPPKISILSPVNQTYNESSVPLVFTVDKTVNWTGYSLDGQQNVTITGNTTIMLTCNRMVCIALQSTPMTRLEILALPKPSFHHSEARAFSNRNCCRCFRSISSGCGGCWFVGYFKKRKQ